MKSKGVLSAELRLPVTLHTKVKLASVQGLLGTQCPPTCLGQMKFTKGNKIRKTSKQDTFLTCVTSQLCFFKAGPRIIRETLNSGGFWKRNPSEAANSALSSPICTECLSDLFLKQKSPRKGLSLAQATQSRGLVQVGDRLSLKHTLNILALTISFLKTSILPESNSRLPPTKALWPANSNHAVTKHFSQQREKKRSLSTCIPRPGPEPARVSASHLPTALRVQAVF